MRMPITRRTFAAALVVALLVGAIGGQRAQASDDPAYLFIEDLGGQAVAVLRDKANSSFEEREAAFRALMVRGFDIPTVGRFVLGRHWKAATKEQRKAYMGVFLDFIVRVYTSRFDSYGGEEFVVRSVIADESGDKIVHTQVLRPSGDQPVNVDFRVREKKGKLKVIDAIVEGISMLHTHRVEFTSVINRKGIEGLLGDLRARLEAPIESEAE